MDVMDALKELPAIMGGCPNLILRKAIRDFFKSEPENKVVSNLVEIMGEDPAPLPELLSILQTRDFEPRGARRRPRNRNRISNSRYEKDDGGHSHHDNRRGKFNNNGGGRHANFNKDGPPSAEGGRNNRGEKNWRGDERNGQQQGGNRRGLEQGNGQFENVWSRGNTAAHLQNSLQDKSENAHMKQNPEKLNSQKVPSPPHRFDTEHMTAVVMPEDMPPNEMEPKKTQNIIPPKNERHSVEEPPSPNENAKKEVADEKNMKEQTLPILGDIKIPTFQLEKPLSPPRQSNVSEEKKKEEIDIPSQQQPRENIDMKPQQPKKKKRVFPPNMPIDVFFANVDRLSHVERGEILHDYIAQLIQENHVLRNANKGLVFKYDERQIDGEFVIGEEFMPQVNFLRQAETYANHGTSKIAFAKNVIDKRFVNPQHAHEHSKLVSKKAETKDLNNTIQNSAKAIDSSEPNEDWTSRSPEDKGIPAPAPLPQNLHGKNPTIIGDVRVRNDVYRPKGDVRALSMSARPEPFLQPQHGLSLSPEKLRKKGMNVHAKEFSMQNAAHQIAEVPQPPPVQIKEDDESVLTYEDFVRLRKSEIARLEYEEMMENIGFQEHIMHETELADLYPYAPEDVYGMQHAPMPRQHARQHHHQRGREPPRQMHVNHHAAPVPYRHVVRPQDRHRQRIPVPPSAHAHHHRQAHARKYPSYIY